MESKLAKEAQEPDSIGLVVPTILSRPGLLPVAVASIAGQNRKCKLVVSAPVGIHSEILPLIPNNALLIAEPEGVSLAEKINAAIKALPDSVKFIGWLGDDDILEPSAIAKTAKILEADPQIVLVFGRCNYIDPFGKKIGLNKSGQWAARVLGFGPDLVPQPGALWRRDAFEAVGGLSSEFNLAFDYDLFLKLRAKGRLKYIPQTLASFRWHPDSLSVKKRGFSVLEASKVRRKHYRGQMRVLWPLWEPWVISTTWLAGKLLSLLFIVSNKSR